MNLVLDCPRGDGVSAPPGGRGCMSMTSGPFLGRRESAENIGAWRSPIAGGETDPEMSVRGPGSVVELG